MGFIEFPGRIGFVGSMGFIGFTGFRGFREIGSASQENPNLGQL